MAEPTHQADGRLTPDDILAAIENWVPDYASMLAMGRCRLNPDRPRSIAHHH